jgi:hypothetical protein
VSDAEHDRVISEYVADVVEKWLEMEAREPQDAAECIKRELCLLLDLEAEDP